MSTTIGIIGSGVVGQTLANGFIKHGYSVMVGTNTPGKRPIAIRNERDMGGVEAARAIEPLCILWCIPGFLSNSWTHAFKLLTA